MYDTPAVSMAQLQELNSAETVVLTVNKRYARRLLGHLSARLAGAGGTVAVPEIVPLGAWLAQASDPREQRLLCHHRGVLQPPEDR